MQQKINYVLILFIIVGLFCFQPLTYAQDTLSASKAKKEEEKHSLGLLGSLDCGLGLSYHYQYPKSKFGVQVSTLPFYSSGLYTQFVGVALHYYFLKREKINLFAYLGSNTSFLYGSNIGFVIFTNTSGLGGGANFKIGSNWTLQCQLGYAFNVMEESFTKNRSFVSPGIGVLYNF